MRRRKGLLLLLALPPVLSLAGCVSSGRLRAQVEKTRDAGRDLRVQRERSQSLEQQLSASTQAFDRRGPALRRENDRLQQQFREAQAALPAMRDTLENCQGKLATVENVSRAELLARLEGASQVMSEKEQKAFYRGILDVWQTLSVVGTPRVEKGWFINDCYYTFQVQLRGQRRFQFTVETKQEAHEVFKAFGLILNPVDVAALFVAK